MNLQKLLTTPVRIQTFHQEFLADMDTPVSTFYKLNGQANSFLLESMEGDGRSGRYSIIGLKPMLLFKRFSTHTEIQLPDGSEKIALQGNPFDHLRQLLNQIQFDREAPFECGLLCGYLSYDSIRYIERIPARATDDLELPEMLLVLPSEVVIFDNFTHTQKLIVHLEAEENSPDLTQRAEKRLNDMLQQLSRRTPQIKRLKRETRANGATVNISKPDYLQSVAKAKAYIRNGDIFQVVLSRRFQKPISCAAFDIYRMLHLINPSPYMFYLNFAEAKIIGSSPETLVKFDGKRVTVRPIAGTRRRGRNRQEDREIAKELLSDEKELAEHVMLVDLGRNDIGRIARYGSVRLESYQQVENYSHVMHIVSEVSGELRPELDAIDAFKAGFPAGTVSGTPKIRAMEIIDELEKTRRGPYAGAIGYFDFQGRMDTCITIRTMLVKDKTAFWQAGGGIVADSVPENEFEETENKARALHKALALAEEI